MKKYFAKEKEVRLMATPIAATPVLKGRDLKSLLDDVKRPDRGQEKRELARQLLKRATDGRL